MLLLARARLRVTFLAFLLYYKPRYPDCGVSGHLLRAKATTFEAFFPQLRCPIWDMSDGIIFPQ